MEPRKPAKSKSAALHPLKVQNLYSLGLSGLDTNAVENELIGLFDKPEDSTKLTITAVCVVWVTTQTSSYSRIHSIEKSVWTSLRCP